MKMERIIISVLFVLVVQLCFGQGQMAVTRKSNMANYSDEPLYVLKSNKKTLVVDANKDETIDLKSINSNDIESINILKGEDAKKQYGERGANGVVIIQFKSHYILTDAMYKKSPIKR